ncbi:SpoIIE family protein phosphatase [Streptomyces sp. NPDC058335]|uniref:ATP-binding SpoIIE family protein phosphatase n=1 Tax=Streptomyces sp. NPDC058335 TaxID=3346451 RepID=UPI0036664C17
MSGSSDHDDGGASFAFDTLAAAVLDEGGTVLRWSSTAAKLVGYTATEVRGRPVRDLVADVPGGSLAAPLRGTTVPVGGRALLRHSLGGTVDVTFRVFRLEGAAELLALAALTQMVSEQELGVSLLRALFSQDGIGIGIHDPDLALLRTNLDPAMFGGPPAQSRSRPRDVLIPEDADDIEASLRQVLESGVSLVGAEKRIRSPQVPEREWTLRMSAVRLEDAAAHPAGVAVLFTDMTEQRQARRHLDLLREAAIRVGGSLDVQRTAQQLAEVVVPALGSLGIVDLAEAVLEGDEPPKWSGGGDFHLRAVGSATSEWPGRIQRGESLPPLPDHPAFRRVQHGETVVMTRQELVTALDDPELVDLLLPGAWHSMAIAPLYARGLILGDLQIWRVKESEPFTPEDVELVTEIASRGALAIDNARRYTREHRAAVALQHRLLPRATNDTPAAETVGIYRPASGGAEIGGDWFDVIRLPSLRLALVVGDVAGHGLPATASMGRLRTAIHTLADLELAPDELLTRLDGLVQRLSAEASPRHRDTVSATCLYVVYDPVSQQCTLASAGHPPPVVVRSDGTEQDVPISPGPPLGVGGMPFETTTVTLEPDSLVALYTKGLMLREDCDIDAGLRRLTDRLAAHHRPDAPLDEVGRSVLVGIGDQPARDDIALLLARTRAVRRENTAGWEFPADPTVVAEARDEVTRQLTEWGLDDLAFTTELVVSELVTNAIRYAGGPVGVRLIREDVLVCEVTDPSNTQPRLRRARSTEEGGRGLFLVAQLTTRWGCRYGQTGKTIWVEQSLTEQTGPFLWDVQNLVP